MTDALVLGAVNKARIINDLVSRGADRLLYLGARASERSYKTALGTYNLTRSSQVVEPWAALTGNGWSAVSTLQVSGGKLFANGGGTAAQINHALAIPAGGMCRIVTTLNIPASGSFGSGNLIIGIDEDTAGSVPTAGGAQARGLQFHLVGDAPQRFDKGSAFALTNTTAYGSSTQLTITIVIDQFFQSITAVSADGTQEWRYQWSRGSVTPNNVYIYNGDSQALSGRSVGPLSVQYAMTTTSPRSATGGLYEGANRAVVWTAPNTGINKCRVATPPNYDASIGAPLALMWHGRGSDETGWADNGNGKVVANALLAAGFITAGFSQTTTLSPWGAQIELDSAYATYRYVRDNFNIGPVVFYANSMGGIDSLLELAANRIPGIMAWIGTSPTFDLSANYNNTLGQPFKADIDSAYSLTTGTLSGGTVVGATSLPTTASYPTIGTKIMVGIATANMEIVTTTGASNGTTVAVTALVNTHSSADAISDYPTKTAGHDPKLLTPNLFRGVPALILSASDDAAVDPTANALSLVTALTPTAPEMLANTANTGGHSFDFTPYTIGTSAYDIVNFAKRHCAA